MRGDRGSEQGRLHICTISYDIFRRPSDRGTATDDVVMRFTIVLSILGLHALVAAEPSQLRLFHRLHHPQAALVPFTERGTVTFADNNPPSFQPSSSFLDDFDSFADAFQTEKIPSGQWLYQVALQRHGDNVESQWDISSVKAVSIQHLNPSFDILNIVSATYHLQRLKLYTSILSMPANRYHTLLIILYPPSHMMVHVLQSRLLSSRSPRKSTQPWSLEGHPPHLCTFPSTKLDPTRTNHHSRPILITPPPLSPQGEPIVPIPEKTFIQKYWMYMVAILIFTRESTSFSPLCVHLY